MMPSARIVRRIAATLSTAARPATAGALKVWRAFISALQEGRRREAALLLAQYCPGFDAAEFMRNEYGLGEAERHRRLHGPLSEAEIAFFKSHSKAGE